jgi:hypothetical protein
MAKPIQHGYIHLDPTRDGIIRRLIQLGLFFAPWIGDVETELVTNVDGTRTRQIVNASGSIVERVSGFVGDGTDTAEIPIQLDLEDAPLTGNAYFPGTGEKLRYEWRKVFINQIGKVVERQSGKLERLRTDKLLQIYKRSAPALVKFMRKWLNAEFISAIYDGHSMNVTKGLNDSPEGIGAKRVFHPNMYINGVNASTGADDLIAVGNEGKNKTTAQINASRIVTGTAPTKPSVFFLEKVGEKLDELMIQKQATYQGKKYWLSVLNRPTLNLLKLNETFRKELSAAFMGKEYNNPLFGHDVWIWGEFMFAVDALVPRAWDASINSFAGTGGYINRPTYTSSHPHYFIEVFGGNALGWADVIPFETRTHTDNFGLFIEMLALLICGLGRGEYVDDAVLGQYFSSGNDVTETLENDITVRNNSSAIFAVGLA